MQGAFPNSHFLLVCRTLYISLAGISCQGTSACHSTKEGLFPLKAWPASIATIMVTSTWTGAAFR